MQQRLVERELMDDPALDAAEHVCALRGLARINWWSRAAAQLWPPIRDLARERRGERLRVLDVACGGGDVTSRLWKLAQREGIDLEVEGADVSARAVEFATQRARRSSANVRFFRLDALGGEMPVGYDVIISSLFVHHLASADAQKFLGAAARATTRMVVLSDLERSWRGLAVARLGTRILSRSRVVHADGPQSVRAALSIAEIRELAAAAGMSGADIARRWPMRWRLVWRKME